MNIDDMTGQEYFGTIVSDLASDTRRHIMIQVKDPNSHEHIAALYVETEVHGDNINTTVSHEIPACLSEHHATHLGAALMNLRASIIGPAEAPYKIARDHRRYEQYVAQLQRDKEYTDA